LKLADLDQLSFDQLLSIRERIDKLIGSWILTEKKELETRLQRLSKFTDSRGISTGKAAAHSARRKYPRVLPKYVNPANSNETWSGRGLPPRWLSEAMKSGKRREDFEISERANNASASSGGEKTRRSKARG
jgi:DNA-binding protein H-NS